MPSRTQCVGVLRWLLLLLLLLLLVMQHHPRISNIHQAASQADPPAPSPGSPG